MLVRIPVYLIRITTLDRYNTMDRRHVENRLSKKIFAVMYKHLYLMSSPMITLGCAILGADTSFVVQCTFYAAEGSLV